MSLETKETPPAPSDFIRDIVAKHVAENKYPKIVTRFPPEPNGYLHIGHAKSICLNFGIAREFGGICNLRMDDTNPTKEDIEYVESIQADVNWLIGGWADKELGLTPAKAPFYASDYFDQIYEFAVALINKGKAFVCDLTPEQTDEYRRTGKASPFRDRSVAENLDLFTRMKAGEFPDGARVLRAKIDVASPNIWLRDPLLYRIKHADHHHTGSQWCIYPMYDFAHCLSDYIEGITHSICTLEFEVHRPLYDWILENLDLPRAAAAPIRIRPAYARLHRHEQTQAHAARGGKTRHRLGRSAHAHDQRHPPARRHRRRPCATSRITSASRNTTASPTSPFWNTPCATT